jgi:UDP-glucose 4-epimerase
MKILVTGGAGFIGSHVADAYVAAGHDVAIIDDLSRGSENNIPRRARFYRGDVRDASFVEKVFAAEMPEAVNHHAAQMDVRRGVREPVFDASVNILGSIHLLDAAVRHKVRRFIYISTAGAAYGEPMQMPVPEDYPINPITPYGISKHTVEHYLFTYSALYQLPYVVLRYGNVYGPRQSPKGEAGVWLFSPNSCWRASGR